MRIHNVIYFYFVCSHHMPACVCVCVCVCVCACMYVCLRVSCNAFVCVEGESVYASVHARARVHVIHVLAYMHAHKCARLYARV